MKKWKYEDEWFEETNISNKIKTYLEKHGHKICRFNVDKRNKGPDLISCKNGKRYIFEVKGYPSDKYVDGLKKGRIKKTKPNTQARHWFAQAILQLFIEKSKNNIIVLGLPRYKIYEDLLNKIQYGKGKTGLKCYFVNKDGTIKIIE